MIYKYTYDKLIKDMGDKVHWCTPYWTLSLRLGECYLNGIGTTKNIHRANEFFGQIKEDKNDMHSWDYATDFESETTRLLKYVDAAPYDVDAGEDDTLIKNEVDLSIGEDLIDLSSENLESYTSSDYLRAYFNTAKYMILKKGNALVCFRNILIVYRQLSCFESDPLFVDRYTKRVEDLLEEKNTNVDS
jgi:hypothetical protein